MTAEIALLAAGLAMIAVAIAWRIRTQRAVRDVLVTALASPSPDERRAAVRVIAEQGVSANAALLLDHACQEEDLDVLSAIALAVARSQWEPVDDPCVAELRLWAQRFSAAWPVSER